MSETPVITASLLAEYCHAAAPRRNRIIELMQSDEFEPFKKWYGEVPGAYRNYMASGREDFALAALEAALVKRDATSDSEEDKILLQLDAIEHVRHIDYSKIPVGVEVLAYQHPARTTEISGVKVRVNPTNVILGNKLGHKAKFVGVLKPYLKKTRELPSEEALIFAAILHWFTARELGDIGEAAFDHCFVAEVFFERLIAAPRAFVRRRELIEASCLEIAERWPAVRAKLTRAHGGAAAV
jgi:hypothetical protein